MSFAARLARWALVPLALVGCGEDVVCPADVALRDAAGALVARFCADLATTEEARREGLRGRPALAPDEGLLIVYPVEDPGGVCIRNEGVVFPIDALFLAADGRVVHRELAVPAGDPTVRCSEAPTDRVLEVAAGAAPQAAVRADVE